MGIDTLIKRTGRKGTRLLKWEIKRIGEVLATTAGTFVFLESLGIPERVVNGLKGGGPYYAQSYEYRLYYLLGYIMGIIVDYSFTY